MAVYDRMPKFERLLVHQFGLVIVSRLMEAGYRGNALRKQLEDWRRNRQEQVLT